MKRLLSLLAIPLLGLTYTGASGQTATCQDLTVQLDGTGNYSLTVGSSTPQVDVDQPVQAGLLNGLYAWQSFTPNVDGVLHSVSVYFTAPFTVSSSYLAFYIYDGQGSGGTTLFMRLYQVGSTFNIGWNEFVLDKTLDLTSGNEYTLMLGVGSGEGPISIQKNNGNPYADGVSSISTTDDLVFNTKMLERPDIDNGSTDATYGLASFGVDVSSFNCSNTGANTVTLTVNNNNGDSSTCTSTVTVEDNEAPVAACQNVSVDLDASGNATITEAMVDNGSSDNCSVSLSLDVTSFTCGDVGANTVTLTVEDPTGNTDNCTATVTVNDATAANALCQDKTLVLGGSGSATLLVSDINNGSTDNCAIATKVLDQTSFNCSDVGTNTVTLTVTDVNSNVSSCSATVTVQDNQAPSITCPSNIVACSADASGATVTYAAVTGTDNCGYTISQTDLTGLTSGSTFPIGTTTQDWGIEDAAGNTNSCSFTVTVDATPVADYSFIPACAGESVYFTDESTIETGYSITSWTWNMDDGSGLISLVDPIHVFADTGMYDVALTVVSANGCSSTSTQTVHVTPVPSASFTHVSACEGNGTAFTNTSTIGAGTLTYAWDFGDGNTSTDQDPTHTYAVSGTYTVTMTATSDNGCEDVATVFVQVNDSPTALFSATTACEGDATVFTNLSTGAGTLTYSWDFGDGNTSIDANPTNTYATDGSFIVVLTTTNDNGCIDTHTANVTVNNLPDVTFSFSNVCEGTQANFVNTSSTGTYNWDLGDGNSSTLSNVNHAYSNFGTYDVTLTVTSSQFCVNSLTQQIEVYDLPDFILNPTDVSCYGDATGSIVAVAQGTPAPPWTLSLNSGTPQASVTFNDLSAGNYNVTAVDANGCAFTVSTTVSQPSDTLGINLLGLQDNLCNGDNSGEISMVGTGGTAPYTYAVDAGTPQSSGLFSGLAAGSHDIEIVDAHSCVFDTTIILSEPPVLELGLVTSSDLLCNGDNSGSITVASVGGVSTYQYNLDGGTYDVADMFDGLAAGNYVVGTMDANGCTDTIHVTLNEPGILMLSLVSSEDALCNGQASGSIEVAAASGTSPYQYSMDGVSFQGSGVFDGLGASSYSLTVRDANGCTDNLNETLTEPTVLTIETNSNPVACFGEATGEIGIIADGGTVGYEYSVDGGSNFFANGGSFMDLTNGTYLAVVRDANGCTASEGVIISQPNEAFVLTADITNAACLGEASGEIALIGTGGTPTYRYSDDNLTFITGNTFGGYAAGSYTLYAHDLNGCVDSVAVTVTEPSTAVSITSTLNSNPACPSEPSGTITVMATGGTPGYTYSSNGGTTFQSNQILSGLNAGNHEIIAMDSNGCTDTETVTLVGPEVISITVDTVVGISCEGQYSGEIHVTAQGGNPSYNYFLNGGNLQTNGDYVNLTNGTYSISVTDVNGCPQSITVDVDAAQLLPVAGFDFTVSGTAVQFNNYSENGSSYSWSFGDDSTSTDQSPVHLYDHHGTYEVTLTVTNDCGEDVYTVSVNTLQTGIADAEIFNFAIYPNPASSELFVQPSSSITSKLYVDVISTTGQILKSTTVNGLDKTGRLAIDVNGLSNGIYYLRLVSENEQTVLRFDVIR